MPVEAGVADELARVTPPRVAAALPGTEQQAVLAGGEEAGEEGAVALVVDLFDFVEALVGGDQRQQLLQLVCRQRRDAEVLGHRRRTYRARPACDSL